MSRIVLVTGGARSGKSRIAEDRTLRFLGSPDRPPSPPAASAASATLSAATGIAGRPAGPATAGPRDRPADGLQDGPAEGPAEGSANGPTEGPAIHAAAPAAGNRAASPAGPPAHNTAHNPGRPAIYIATAEAHDPEMAARIADHQARRGPEWRTVAAPHDLAAALAETEGAPRLVDCLTLWLTNRMLADGDLTAETERLIAALGRARSPVVLVTNEVGWGIVPDNALARRFRDAAGILNQRVAAAACEVWMAACGLPLRLK